MRVTVSVRLQRIDLHLVLPVCLFSQLSVGFVLPIVSRVIRSIPSKLLDLCHEGANVSSASASCRVWALGVAVQSLAGATDVDIGVGNLNLCIVGQIRNQLRHHLLT